MKKWIWTLGIAGICCSSAMAQSAPKKKAAAKQTQTVAKKVATAMADTSFTLISSGSNNALQETARTNYTIADPTIQTFNTRVFTNTIPDNEKAIIGIPKIQTGVGHGRILFYPTASATSGTNTGSGTVGTGSSLGNVGTNGAGMGVNGKNPYAGPAIYGTRVISDLRPTSALAKPVSGGNRP